MINPSKYECSTLKQFQLEATISKFARLISVEVFNI
jgi:hypothetical protein